MRFTRIVSSGFCSPELRNFFQGIPDPDPPHTPMSDVLFSTRLSQQQVSTGFMWHVTWSAQFLRSFAFTNVDYILINRFPLNFGYLYCENGSRIIQNTVSVYVCVCVCVCVCVRVCVCVCVFREKETVSG